MMTTEPPAEMDAWIKGCKTGEFDDLGVGGV